jgi:hypothetical protein
MRTKSELRLMIADREVSFCDEDILRGHMPTQLIPNSELKELEIVSFWCAGINTLVTNLIRIPTN